MTCLGEALLFIHCPGLPSWRLISFHYENFSYTASFTVSLPSFSLFSLELLLVRYYSQDWSSSLLIYLFLFSISILFADSLKDFLNVTFQTFCPGFHFSSPLFVVSVLPCCLNCLFPPGLFCPCLFLVILTDTKKKRNKKLCTWFQDGG